MEIKEPIVSVGADGNVSIGAGYSIGQVLDALEVARRAVLSVVLRPTPAAEQGAELAA
jgi:hypothetical protein